MEYTKFVTILVIQINVSQYFWPIKAFKMFSNELNRDSFRINLLTVPTTILKKSVCPLKTIILFSNKTLNKQKDSLKKTYAV